MGPAPDLDTIPFYFHFHPVGFIITLVCLYDSSFGADRQKERQQERRLKKFGEKIDILEISLEGPDL